MNTSNIKRLRTPLSWLLLLLLCMPLLHAASPVSGVFDVTQFGAVGDGETLNTQAIQKAIDSCTNAGGGTVLLPPGKFLSGMIFLKDNVNLHLSMGAVLLGSTDLDEYPITICDYPSRSDAYTARALIWGEGLENVAITGKGTIDGQGLAFRDNVATPEELVDIIARYTAEGRHIPVPKYFNRPYILRLISCRYVRIENIRMINSPMWMQQYLNCDFVTIRGIHVYNHGCSNNDMMDIDGCRNVTISDCYGDSDDDALTLKSTGAAATEQVTITNCILRSHCNAIKAGTESAGGFKDITISNCVIQRSAAQTLRTGRLEGLAGIALEIVDGGIMDRVAISNIVIEGTNAPIFMRLGNRARPPKTSDPTPPVGIMKNISIQNVVATGAYPTGCSITGLPGHPIENVTLSNINLRFQGGGSLPQAHVEVPELDAKYPECIMFGVLPSYGFFVRHVAGLTLDTVELRYDRPDARPAVRCDDVSQLRITGFEADYNKALATALLLKDSTKVYIADSMSFDSQDSFCKAVGVCEDIVIKTN